MSVSLLGPVEVRELAGRLGLRPTKTLGQNFVHDPNTIRRIVDAAGVDGEDVVEIGPGLGSLTLGLLERAKTVVAVEIDPVLAAELPRTAATYAPERADDLSVVLGDAMRIDALPGEPTALVANLPYNVSVPVLLTFLENVPSLRHGLVMVQAEVAERLAAGPGGRTYGVPSAKAAWYAEVDLAGRVPRNVFWPVPNVESALVRFRRRETPEADRGEVFAVIDAAFSQRRKTLRSALADWAGSPTEAETILRRAGVDPTLRGERLGIDDFVAIARAH